MGGMNTALSKVAGGRHGAGRGWFLEDDRSRRENERKAQTRRTKCAVSVQLNKKRLHRLVQKQRLER